MTKHNSPKKRGRPVSEKGKLLRELGISRLDAWEAIRMAQIPKDQKDQFDAYLDDPARSSKELEIDAILRHFDKLSPDKPRPLERAREDAIFLIEAALEQLDDDPEQVRALLTEVLVVLNAARGRAAARGTPDG